MVFESAVLPRERLLAVFLTLHDAASADRQGADIGPQYRSIILAPSEAARDEIAAALPTLAIKVGYDQPIVTEFGLLDRFYLAEAEHLDYYARHSNAPYCRLVIDPKLKKVRQHFGELLRQST